MVERGFGASAKAICFSLHRFLLQDSAIPVSVLGSLSKAGLLGDEFTSSADAQLPISNSLYQK